MLWTRHFPRAVPAISVNSAAGTVVFGWAGYYDGIKEEMKSEPGLKERFEALKDRKAVNLFVIVDSVTGQKRGSVLIDTGKWSFRMTGISAKGDWLTALDNQNRVLVYSVASGEEKAVYFGNTAITSPAGDLLLVENEPGQVTAYSLTTFQKVRDYQFQAKIAWMHFSADGKRLFVLTRDQHTYLLDMMVPAQTSPSAAR